MSRLEERVISKIASRAVIGKKKYGTTMERNDLSLQEWLHHLQEELMDATVYIEKIMQEVQYQEYNLVAEKEKINYPEPRYRENEIMGDRDDRTTWENPGGSYWENQLDPDVAEHNHNMAREEQAQEELAKEYAAKEKEAAERINALQKHREQRMKIIGQNGNDGLHYDEEDPLGLKWVETRTLYPGDMNITHNKRKE